MALGLLNEPEQQRSPRGATLSDTTGGFSPPAHPPLFPLPLPPSFPSVKNLYFISELWSSSAQLSADKAQEALERRHGYLEEGRGGGGEEVGVGGCKKGRQAGRLGPNPPRGAALSPRCFFFSASLPREHPHPYSHPPTLPSPPLQPHLSGRVQLVPAAANTRSPAQPGSWSLHQCTPTTRKAESN